MTRPVVLLCLVAGLARPAVAQVDQHRAEAFFKEVQALCERDDGRLWGVSLYAPMVIANRRRRRSPPASPHRKGLGRDCSVS